MTSAAPAPLTARRDQPANVGRERAGHRRARKEPQAGHEPPSAAEAVAERGGGHQQHGEAEDISVDGPLELLDRGAKVRPDRGQGSRDHQRVEHDHQGRH
jgi:hypothetical protein